VTTPSRAAVILCVDDEPILLQVRGLVLRHAGFEPVLASTADEALAIFRDRQIDLVITDHLLPDVSGTELAGQMKRMKPAVRIVMMSGAAAPAENSPFIDAFLMKGAPVPDLLSLIESMLKGRATKA